MLATLTSVSVTPGEPDRSFAHCAVGTVNADVPPVDVVDEEPPDETGPLDVGPFAESDPAGAPFEVCCVLPTIEPLPADPRESIELRTLVGKRDPQDEPMKIAIKHNATSRARKLPLP
jgi:hypothetical protein